MVGTDTLDWYCKLRQGKEYDHEYDGVNPNIRKKGELDDDGQSLGMVIGKRNMSQMNNSRSNGALQAAKTMTHHSRNSYSRDQTPLLNSQKNMSNFTVTMYDPSKQTIDLKS